MSVDKYEIISKIGREIPQELFERLLDEYVELKLQFALGRHRPEELQGGRFAEILIRILEHLNDPSSSPYTPLGESINRPKIMSLLRRNTNLLDSIRFFITSAIDILLDVRNRRDVAHVGGDVNPNYSDARLIIQLADWSLTELVRIYYKCSINEAQNIVDRINQIKVPVVAEVEGFLRVQNTSLNMRDRTLLALYHKQPEKQRDKDLMEWIQYQNPSRYKNVILTVQGCVFDKLKGDHSSEF